MGNTRQSVQVAIAMQELLVNGWCLVTQKVNGKEVVKEATNIVKGFLVEFEDDEDFIEWSLAKAEELRELNKQQGIR